MVIRRWPSTIERLLPILGPTARSVKYCSKKSCRTYPGVVQHRRPSQSGTRGQCQVPGEATRIVFAKDDHGVTEQAVFNRSHSVFAAIGKQPLTSHVAESRIRRSGTGAIHRCTGHKNQGCIRGMPLG